MHLDRSRPYGQVYGSPPVDGASWEQDGRYFRHDGELIGDPPAGAPAQPTATDDYRAMDTARLRQLAAVYSIDWTNKGDVIRQLEGRG